MTKSISSTVGFERVRSALEAERVQITLPCPKLRIKWKCKPEQKKSLMCLCAIQDKAVPAFLSFCILVAVPAVWGKTGNCMSSQAANFTTLEVLITLNIRLRQPEVEAN